MKLSEVSKKCGLKAINVYKDKEVEGVYISDMVSDLITLTKANLLLITLQTNKSLIAAANLVDVAAVAFVKGKKPAPDLIELANKVGIGLFTTSVDAWTLASKLTKLGIK